MMKEKKMGKKREKEKKEIRMYRFRERVSYIHTWTERDREQRETGGEIVWKRTNQKEKKEITT